MDRRKFFEYLRRRDSGVFNTKLTQNQVDGIEAVLDECIEQGASLKQTAYILSTGYGESNKKMQPTYENLYYKPERIPEVFSASRRRGVPINMLARNPKKLANTVYGGEWGEKNLGNTKEGDGWRFRGTGIGQITGRRNFTKWGKNLNLPLVHQPSLMMDLETSVKSLVRPMLEGWATSYKLSDFVNDEQADYHNARRVWNGLKHASRYAKWARSFEAALKCADYKKQAKKPQAKPSQKRFSFLELVLNLLWRKS